MVRPRRGRQHQGETDADERINELDQLAIEDLRTRMRTATRTTASRTTRRPRRRPDAGDLDAGDLDAGDLDIGDLDDEEDSEDDGPGDEDGEARPGIADSARDEPSPFEIHYLPPGDPSPDDGDPETAGDPGRTAPATAAQQTAMTAASSTARPAKSSGACGSGRQGIAPCQGQAPGPAILGPVRAGIASSGSSVSTRSVPQENRPDTVSGSFTRSRRRPGLRARGRGPQSHLRLSAAAASGMRNVCPLPGRVVDPVPEVLALPGLNAGDRVRMMPPDPLHGLRVGRRHDDRAEPRFVTPA